MVSLLNPNNTAASVNLNWYNDGSLDWPRLRYGGSGVGSSNGFLIQGPGNSTKLAILENGDIGIGTIAPGARLDIAGGGILLDADAIIYGHQTSSNRGFLKLYDGSTGDVELGTTFASGAISFTAGGSEQARITTSGLTLTANRKIMTSWGKTILEDLSGSGDSLRIGYNTGAKFTAGLLVYDGGDKLGLHVFGGNVGIGKTNPAAKLDVAGQTRTDTLQIDGGADLAEPFEIFGAENVVPGLLVSIDPEHPGQLRIASAAYDHMVAGCVSGANGLNPGLVMQQQGSPASGAFPVALSGRVYCLADASYGAIQPGDLLTSSDTPGHVMAVGEYDLAQGAIIGKAMSALDEGLGLVLVLVSLQ
jgi:hypothetical protein